MGYKVVITCKVANETQALEVIERVVEYIGAAVVCAEIEKIGEE